MFVAGELWGAGAEPVFLSEGGVVHVEVGGRAELQCEIARLGPLVRLWKQGARVIFAGEMRVRRDKRLVLGPAGQLIIQNIEPTDEGLSCELILFFYIRYFMCVVLR